MQSWISRAAIGLGVVSAACHAHVTLDAPPPNAAPQARAKAYAALRPLSYHQTHITTLQGGVPVGGRRVTDYLQLANGTRVYYPEDLLPVLPESSVAANAARESASKRQSALMLEVVASVAMLAGIGLALIPLAAKDYSFAHNTGLLYGGVGAMAGGALLYGISLMAIRPAVDDAAATAFETYDVGLREQLGVCRDGDRDIMCPHTPVPARSVQPYSL